jgi:hypothetical protein
VRIIAEAECSGTTIMLPSDYGEGMIMTMKTIDTQHWYSVYQGLPEHNKAVVEQAAAATIARLVDFGYQVEPDDGVEMLLAALALLHHPKEPFYGKLANYRETDSPIPAHRIVVERGRTPDECLLRVFLMNPGRDELAFRIRLDGVPPEIASLTRESPGRRWWRPWRT